MMANGLAKQVKDNAGLKVLGSGELTAALTVKAAKFSASRKRGDRKGGRHGGNALSNHFPPNA